MIFLLLALLFSLLIVVTFKLFPLLKIDNFQAITVNYLVTTICGSLTLGEYPYKMLTVSNDWIFAAALSGIFLFVVFNLFALNAELVGVALTSVSSKMSVIIPVLFGFILFDDAISIYKIFGIALAMVSFFLIFRRKGGYSIKAGLILLPFSLFLGNGINDSLFKFAQYNYLHQNDTAFVSYLTIAFTFSLTLGILTLVFRNIKTQTSLSSKNVLAGIWLGLLNWFSSLFFLTGLGKIDVSVFIPIFNASLVTASSLIGVFIFKEKLNKINVIGLVLAIIAISIIAYAG